MEFEKIFSRDYSGYTAVDLLAEDSFTIWAKHRGENPNLDLYWEMIARKYPGLDAEIEKALKMTQILSDQKVYTIAEDPAEAWRKVHKRIVMTGPVRMLNSTGNFFIRHRNIAAIFFAVILIAGAAGAGYLLRPVAKSGQAFTTIYSPAGQRTEVTLPDNSKVLLNSKTTLKYSAGFNSSNREIYLDGEGYFDVKKGSLPFEVKTEAMNIRVLGTAFNVKCYSDETVVEATLVRGSMIVEKLDTESEVVEEIRLTPNQKVVFNKDQGSSGLTAGEVKAPGKAETGNQTEARTSKEKKLNVIDSYDTQKSTGWINGLLIVEGETLQDLSKKIERRYDVSIVFMSDRLRSFKYTGTLKEYSLEQVLKALEATSPISYKVDKYVVYIGENKEEIDKYMKLMN
jgi:ferric-dicitrate binding protein FerR (iron transport regulator)